MRRRLAGWLASVAADLEDLSDRLSVAGYQSAALNLHHAAMWLYQRSLWLARRAC